MSHRIRLGPPWEVSSSSEGRTRHVRRFGRPGNLDVQDEVWLTCDCLPVGAAVLVNGVPVRSSPGASDFPITSLLQQRNVVEIQLATDVLGEVALEIRRIDSPLPK